MLKSDRDSAGINLTLSNWNNFTSPARDVNDADPSIEKLNIDSQTVFRVSLQQPFRYITSNSI